MSATPWRVLAADDDPTAGLLMQAVLGGGDFVLTLVDNGNDALARFQASAYDIALLDVEMPGRDGFEVCSAIRQTHGVGFPVVLVTGRSDPLFLEKARQLSASHIAKPIDWTSLAGQLRSLLAAKR
ncbi:MULTISPECIES: response regulator [Azonexaceae]|uniref:response regulator n=1 Tax=Azonexaceae TaxID=2008795 RepID=UPI001CF8014A|nr:MULTISPECIES: response regulator [Azonexaceae]UCV22119.1 response regulator [Ferribacterium limneticum]